VAIHDTPGIPGSVLKTNEGGTIKDEPYRTLVGKLMFYTTKVGLEAIECGKGLIKTHGESWRTALDGNETSGGIYERAISTRFTNDEAGVSENGIIS